MRAIVMLHTIEGNMDTFAKIHRLWHNACQNADEGQTAMCAAVTLHASAMHLQQLLHLPMAWFGHTDRIF